MSKVVALVRVWLTIDFFGDARRAGKADGSSLTTTIFAQSFFAFVFAWLLFPDTPPIAFAAANLCLSSLLIAIGALGDQGRPERRAADEHIVRTAPMSRTTLTLARAAHSSFAVVLVTVGMALPPGILLAYLQHDILQLVGYVAGACVCSGLACGVLGAIAAIATRWWGAMRTALLLGSIKAVLLGAGVVLFATTLSRLQKTVDAIPIGRAGAELLPPYHIARWLASPGAEGWRLLALLGAGLVLLAIVVAAEGAPATAVSRRIRGHDGPLHALLRRLAKSGPRLGIAAWVAIAMWRSPGFRARALPLLGLPAAMAMLTVRDPEHDLAVLTSILLQLPAIYVPFLIAFLPRADQPGTAWLFEQAPTLPRGLVADATWRALVTHVLLPVHALAFVLLAAFGGDPLHTASASLFAVAVAIVAARAASSAIDDVPFTRQHEGDGSLELGGVMANALLLGAVGAGFGLLPSAGARWVVAGAAAAIAATMLSRRPRTADATEELAWHRTHAAEVAKPAAAAATPNASATAPADAAVTATEAPGVDRPPPTLRRELRAIVVLYLCLCVLPAAVGTFFAA